MLANRRPLANHSLRQLPPVWPTLTPRLAMKRTILTFPDWCINQISTFPKRPPCLGIHSVPEFFPPKRSRLEHSRRERYQRKEQNFLSLSKWGCGLDHIRQAPGVHQQKKIDRLGAGIEAEDPLKLSIRSVIFILLAFFSNEIVSMILTIGGTPYNWIMDSELPALSFADFNSVMLVIIGVCANGAVALITLILVIILAWNYLKLLLEAAERYVLLGVLVYTAPVAFSMGASQTTSNIWKSWCRMLGGQIFLLLMNAWCLRLFTSMVGSFISNPLSL